MFQMSLDLCRCCLDDYVVSIMFFDLCLVDGVCWLVSQRDLILSGKAGSLPSTKRIVGQQQPENSG
jgi:hypothetical protein